MCIANSGSAVNMASHVYSIILLLSHTALTSPFLTLPYGEDILPPSAEASSYIAYGLQNLSCTLY